MNSGDTFGAIDSRVTVGHMHLKVADLERALSVYRGVLGSPTPTRLRDYFVFAANETRKANDQTAQLGEADTADLFTGVSRDKALWMLEAHNQN